MIPELFERQVLRRGDKPAIAGTAWQPGYAELGAVAGGIATTLLSRAAEVGPVALLMRHDAPLIAAILGVLRAGKVVVTLNPSDPPTRLRRIRDDVAPQAVITDPRNRELALRAGFDAAEVVLLPERPEASGEDRAVPGADDLAFLIYTSGSTGRPNGVMQPHRNVVHNVMRQTSGLGLRPDDRIALLASPSGGQGMATTTVALLNGATLCPFPLMERGVAGLPSWLEQNDVSVVVFSASVFRNFVRSLDRPLSGIRLLRLGSEAALRSDYEACRRHFPPECSFANAYSSSETGNVTQFLVRGELDHAARELPLGRPADGMEVLLLDDAGQPAAAGAVGEIVVRSDHLSPGYWRNPELTARRLGDGHFRTGDLGRMSEDGLLTWVARRDMQVKVRASRVDLSEVESALGRLPGVQVAVAGPRRSERGDTRLAAYVIPDRAVGARPAYIRDALRARLPGQSVPTEFAFLESFPVNAHGKVDRAALATLELERLASDASRPLVGETEELVADAWARAFDRDFVAPDENFFELGGDSLTAAVVAAGIHSTLGVELELEAFAGSPTVAEMARLVERLEAGAEEALPALTRVARDEPLRCSFIQERTWRHSRTPEESAGYTVSGGVSIRGPLEVDALRRCAERVVNRHEILRTVYAERGGEPVQVIQVRGPVELPLIEVGSRAEADEVYRRESRLVFDLERGPLLRLLIVRLADDHHWLLRSNHHINSDGRSWQVFFDQLWALYEADVRGEPAPPLQEDRLQYADFAAWERRQFETHGVRLRAEIDWWQRTLDGAPPRTPLPFARRRPAPGALAADGAFSFGIPAGVSERLEALRRSAGVTFFMVRVAALAAQLAVESGEDDVMIGTYASTRRLPETHAMFGFFTNLVALRLRFRGGASFRQWLATVREAVVGMSAHSPVPYGELCDALRAEGTAPPELHSVFSAGDAPRPARRAGLEVTPLERIFGSMPWGFTLQVDPVWEAERNQVAFDARLHEPAAVRRFVDRYVRLLAAAGAEPDRPLRELLSPWWRLSRILRRVPSP